MRNFPVLLHNKNGGVSPLRPISYCMIHAWEHTGEGNTGVERLEVTRSH